MRWTGLPKYVHTIVADTPSAILLETSRFDASNSHSYLFLNPVRVLSANSLDQIPQVLGELEEAIASGLYAAGFLSYECGYHFQNVGGVSPPQGLPLLWFGLYRMPRIFDHALGSFDESVLASDDSTVDRYDVASICENFNLGITKENYLTAILEIKERILAGETYQVNFTDHLSFDTQLPMPTLFESLLEHQSVAYGAFLNIAGHHILSFSPELFFKISNRHIVTRPMKGTMPRGLDSFEDENASRRLRDDEKNRSEHVMIVDLLRNDLGRICTTGSIKVDDLFTVERYETLLQMTSTISGRLRPDVGFYDILQSMFPSGSITGAPKLSTMKIIRELEQRERGIYTGAIGFISPGDQSVFNVAIRTLVVKDGKAWMGLGGGIVADSDPEDEYRECQLKAAFLSCERRDFQLIEAILWEEEFRLLASHMDRLESSASYFNFPFDRAITLARLNELASSFSSSRPYRVRVLLPSSGDTSIQDSELQPERFNGHVKLSSEKTQSSDRFLRHKTTHRQMYDREYAEARRDGFAEVIFMNEKGEVTEGSISNIFVMRSGTMLTPPLHSGVLPGIYRRYLLDSLPNVEEKILYMEDLETADAVFLCNSLRGMRRVESLCLGDSYIFRTDDARVSNTSISNALSRQTYSYTPNQKVWSRILRYP